MGARWIHGVEGNVAYKLAFDAGVAMFQSSDGSDDMGEIFDQASNIYDT